MSIYLKKNITFEKLIRLFFIAYVIFGLAMSAVATVSKLAIIFLVLALSLVIRKILKENISIPYFIYLYSLFYMYIMMSWFWSYEDSFNILGSVLTVYLASLVCILMLLFKICNERWLITVFLIPGVINIAAYVFGINYVSVIYDLDPVAAFSRFGGFVGHPNAMVTRLLLPIFVSVIFIKELKAWKLYTRYILPFSFIIATFAVYSSGSKKAFLFIVISSFIIMSFYISTKKIVLATLVTSLISLIFLNTKFDLSSFDLEVFNRFEQFFSGEDESTEERALMLLMGPILFFTSPIVGTGLNSFSELSGLGYYSHNNIVEILVSGGVVGFILYYGVVICSLYFSLKKFTVFWVNMVVILLVFLDFTGVTYLDRGAQLFVALLFFKSQINVRKY